MAISNATLAGLTRTQLLEMHYMMALCAALRRRALKNNARQNWRVHAPVHRPGSRRRWRITNLRPEDKVLSSYREHGHAIIKGMEPRAVMAELFGKITGCSKGKGGSMHMWSNELGLFGGNGIVAAQLPMAAGLAFAAQYQGRVTMCFFGDGAVDEGAFHNRSTWHRSGSCPLSIFAKTTSTRWVWPLQRPGPSILLPRAAAYNMPGEQVDGMDVIAVYEAARRAEERARGGEGPTLLEIKTYRFRGHSMTDPAYYRTREEEQQWRNTRDPIGIFEKKLLEQSICDPGRI